MNKKIDPEWLENTGKLQMAMMKHIIKYPELHTQLQAIYDELHKHDSNKEEIDSLLFENNKESFTMSKQIAYVLSTFYVIFLRNMYDVTHK